MLRYLYLFTILCTAGCTLLDRSEPPQIVDVTTDLGENPSVGRGREVNLKLFTEDADNDELDFQWTASGGVFTGSSKDTLIDLFQDSVTVVWRAPGEVGVYGLAVEVSDGVTGETVTEMLQIAVTQGPPVAELEPDRIVAFQPGQTVVIDGSASSDPDLDQLSYFWRQILGPAVSLQGSNGPTPEFLPPATGDYVFELAVADNIAPGVGDTSEVDVVVIRVLDRGGRGG
ncbi:MAG: hypothetical protein CME19_00455 [Gemmatimonadetes bacterium]|nr:hypothetical protein [Gemmatimonadota bacterium]|tara:strand:+ start:1318 stop:2004 length:687 start_codon:yes stop_codon:yes gene_type:complete